MFLPCGGLVPAHRAAGTAGSSLGLQRGRAGLGAALGGCGAQTVHLRLGQLAVLAGLEHSQLDDALSVPLQTDDLETHGFAHPADLAVLALFQGHLHDGAARLVGDDVDGAGHGLGAVVQYDAGAELQDLCLIGPGLDGDAVELGDTAGRGMINKIKEIAEEANILALDYDASAARVNQENRIKLMLATAK